MTHTSDAKHAALLTQTGQVSGATDDLEQLYLETQTGLTGHVNDLWYALFVQNGATSGDWNDAAYEFLLTLGAPAGHIDDMWYYFWDTLGGAIGPTVVIQGNGDTGQCTYELPATTECFATQTFTANDTNFTNPANQWVWSIESGDAEITAGAGTKTVTVRTPSVLTGESSTNVTFELKVIATDTVSTDSATRTTSFTHQHIDETPAPLFIGPNIDTTELVQNAAMTPFDVSPRFSGYITAYSLVGTWPAGLSIDNAGVLTGTPTDPLGDYTNLQFRATGPAGSADSNLFTVEIIAGAVAPVFIGPNVLNQILEVNVPYTLDLRPLFTGTAPTYSVTTGVLPTGLTLDPSGIISGTPTVVDENDNIVVTATNGAGSDTTNTFNMLTDAAPVFSGTIPDQTWTLNAAITPLDTSTYFANNTSVTYSSGGTLPAGVSLDTNTGIISGTPTVETTGSFTVTATNAFGADTSNSVAYTVQDVALPSFEALVPDPTTYEMLGVKTGTGDLTTTHTADLYAPDVDGGYRVFGANEPVWSGGRVVQQLLSETEDYSVSKWAKSGVTVSGDIIEATTGTAYIGQSAAFSAIGAIKVDSVNSVDVRGIGSSIGKIVTLGNNISGDYLQITLTSDFVRYSIPSDYTNSSFGWYLYLAGLNGANLSVGEQVEMRRPQAEQKTGMADLTTPSEYVAFIGINSTTEGPKVTNVFANQNGNTVLNNVVTEAVGAPLAEAPYLQYYPAAQNDCTYSNDLTNAAWTPLNSVITSRDQVGLTGEPNTATLLDDQSAAANGSCRQDITTPIDSNTHTAVVYVNKDTNQTRFPAVDLRLTGGTAVIDKVQFNTETGATNDQNGVIVNHESVDLGDRWKILFEVANNNTNNLLRLNIFPADSAVWGGFSQNAATGSIIVGNVELHLNKTIAQVRGLGPIFTTTAAVATDVTVYQMDAANAADDDTAWYFEVGPYTQTENLPLITRNTFTMNQGLFSSTAGANSRIGYRQITQITSLDNARTLDVAYKYSAIASEGLANLRTEAVTWKVDAAWDNTPWWTGMYLGNANGFGAGTAPIQLRNIQRYDITSLQQGKDIIDGLLA